MLCDAQVVHGFAFGEVLGPWLVIWAILVSSSDDSDRTIQPMQPAVAEGTVENSEHNFDWRSAEPKPHLKLVHQPFLLPSRF
jgi:hypothetical protein